MKNVRSLPCFDPAALTAFVDACLVRESANQKTTYGCRHGSPAPRIADVDYVADGAQSAGRRLSPLRPISSMSHV